MLTRQKVAPRREICNYAKKVYITFDANEERKEEFTLILGSEEEACSFAACLRNLLKEVDEKGHYNTGIHVEIFTDQPKGFGNITIGETTFKFTCGEGTDAKIFHEAFAHEVFAHEVWGDTSD